jgi:tetratricopeptide (TPR) repeat protein
MKQALRRFLVINRLPIAFALIGLGFVLGFEVTWWIAWLPFLIAILMVVAHFLIGPMTLIQRYVEDGDMEGAQKIMEKVKYPNLLYKPVRSSYYMLRANISTMTDDLDKAEADLKKGLETGMGEKEFEGTAYLQLGSIAFKKGNTKEAYEYLRKAVKVGLPDKDSEATAYLQLSGIAMQRRDFRSCKTYFAKAKACKSKNEQVVAQINEMSKYMSRIPG